MGQEVGWPVVIEPPQRPVSVRLYRLGLGHAMAGRSHERLPYLTVRVTMGYGQLLAGLANVHSLSLGLALCDLMRTGYPGVT